MAYATESDDGAVPENVHRHGDGSNRSAQRPTRTFTLADIRPATQEEHGKLICLRVDSPGHQFLVGNLGVPTHNTDEAKHASELAQRALSDTNSIARLGRAAGVHMAIATQRPDAAILGGGQLKSNLGMRAACGNMDSTASGMTLGSGSATRTPGNPKGRAILSVYGNEQKTQVYFTTTADIDKWLDAHGRNPDASPKMDMANLPQMGETTDSGDNQQEHGNNGVPEVPVVSVDDIENMIGQTDDDSMFVVDDEANDFDTEDDTSTDIDGNTIPDDGEDRPTFSTENKSTISVGDPLDEWDGTMMELDGANPWAPDASADDSLDDLMAADDDSDDLDDE